MPIYSIEGRDGKTYEIDGPDGLSREQVIAEVLRRAPQAGQAPAAAPKPTERTWGEAATDIGAGVVKGVGSLVQLPGQLYGLATGDFSDTGVLGAGKDIEEYGESLKSQGLKEREAARARAVQAADGQVDAFKTSFLETVKDPALLSSFVAEQLPQLIPIIASGGLGAAAAAGRTTAAELAKGATKEAAAAAARAAAARVGTTAAIQTGAVMQGTDVGASTYDAIYQNVLQRTNDPQQAADAALNRARAAGVAGYGLSVLANRYLPGGQALEKALTGPATGRGLLAAGAAGALKEIPSENVEEVGGALARNIALQNVDPTQSLTQGLGETAAQATLGAAALGGAAGAYSGRGPAPVPAPTPPAPPTPPADETADAGLDEEAGPVDPATVLRAEEYAARMEATNPQGAKELREAAARLRAKADAQAAQAAQAAIPEMSYAEAVKQRAALRAGPQTAATKSTIDALSQRITDLGTAQVQGIYDEQAQAEKAAKQADRQAKREARAAQRSAFSQEMPDLFGQMYPEAAPQAQPEAEPEPIQQDVRQLPLFEGEQPGLFGMMPPAPEAEPEAEAAPERPDMRQAALQMPLLGRAPARPRASRAAPAGQAGPEATPVVESAAPVETPLTLPEIEAAMPRPLRGKARTWAQTELVGKTRSEVAAAVQADPTLIRGAGPQPQVYRALLEGARDVTQPSAPQPTRSRVRPEPAPAAPAAEPGVEAPVGVRGGPDVADAAGAVAPDGAGVAPVPGVAAVEPAPESAQPPAVAEEPEPEPEVVSRLRSAKTRDEVSRAMDDLVAAQQNPASPDQEAVANFLTRSMRVPGFRIALEQAEQRARAKRRPATPKPAAEVQAPEEDVFAQDTGTQLFPTPPDYERRMKRADATRTAAQREADLREAWAQVPDVKRAKAAQADLFAQSVAEPAPTPQKKPAPTPQKKPAPLPTPSNFTGTPSGRMGVQVEGRAGPGYSAADVVQKEAPKTAPQDAPAWATERAERYNATVVPVGEAVLLRGVSPFGSPVYLAATPQATTRVDIDAYTGTMFNPQELAQLRAAKAADVAQQASLAAQNPDGPFSGRTEKVVGSESVSQDLLQYATDLLAKVGMGKVRVFLLHPSDLKGAQQKYALYGDYYSATAAGIDANERGSFRLFGPNRKDAYISIDADLSPAEMVETLAHEIGHLIEAVAYKSAPKEVKDAIQAEYRQWVMKAKQGTVRELVESLRNRESAAKVQMSDPNAPATVLTAYWTSFGEWFADNVSRWATTDEKAVGIVEKFFAEVGAKLRRLVSAVTGKKWAPAPSVANFLNAMGPGAADAWLESTSPPSSGQTKYQQVSTAAQKVATAAETDRILSALDMQPVPQKTRMQQALGVLADTKENPRAAAQDLRKATTTWLDKFGNLFVSSNFAFNAEIKRQLRETSLTSPEAMGMQLSVTDAQVDGSSVLAGLFARVGNLVYDSKLYKWVAKQGTSLADVAKTLSDMGQTHGLSKEQVSRVTQAYFVARRTDGLLDRQEDLAAAADVLEAAGDKKQAKAMRDRMVKGLKDRAWVAQALQLEAKFPELIKAAEQWNEVRKNAAKVLVDSGLWTPDEAEEMLSVAEFVPFYREVQLAEGDGPKEFMSGLQVRAKEVRLKGSEAAINDVFDNMMRWTQFAIERSVRNHMAIQRMDAAVRFGLGKQVSVDSNPPNKVTIWRDGRKETYQMTDPLFMDAFKGLESLALPSLGFLAKLTDVFRQSVVLNPLFGILQVPQDAVAAIYTSGLKPRYAFSIPARAVKEFLQTLLTPEKSAVHRELRALGAVGARDTTAEVVKMDLEIMEGARSELGFSTQLVRRIGKLLHHVAMASDSAVRQAVYTASLDQGLSQAEAVEKAFQLINFRNRGTSKGFAALSRLVPFLNAYVAAQHVAYKTLSGNGISPTDRKAARETLAATTLGMMGLSAIYAMALGGDEGYEKRPLYVRDRVFVIPGTDGISIPIRADIFTFPKVFAEHMWHHITDSGTVDGANTRKSMSSLLASSFIGPYAPQLIKPLVEVVFNYDVFRQRPLVGANLSEAETEYQYTDSTSELGKRVGRSRVMSPITFDHLMRGYLGAFGGLVLYTSNALSNTMGGVPRPDMSLWDAIASFPGASSVMPKQNDSALRQDFYELKEAVDRVAQTITLLNGRDPEELDAYLANEDVMALDAIGPEVRSIYKELTEIRKEMSLVRADRDLTAEEKRVEIEALQQEELDLLGSIDIKALRAEAGL